MENSPIEAEVSSVQGNGKGSYAVTRLTGSVSGTSKLTKGATVTFSLSEWQSDRPPKAGQSVLLFDIEKFRGGWRAREARPIRA